MDGPLVIRPAGPEELGTVLEILGEASAWERARGTIDPWPTPFPPERILPGLERGEVYLADLAPLRGVATVNLSWEDPKFWGLRPPDAGYIHRLAVRRAVAGRGLGGRIIEWANAEVLRRGRRFLRLDCLASNRRLVRYYLDAGFALSGTVVVDGWLCQRFEREAAGRGTGPDPR